MAAINEISVAFQACLQLGALRLIAGLAQKGEHILFIAFHTGLIKRIHTQKIAGNRAGLLC